MQIKEIKTLLSITFLCSLMGVATLFCTPKSVETAATTFTVSVANGYGSASYSVGDTVHIWSRTATTNETFTNWTGDTSFFKSGNEWHSWFVMPAQNIRLTANFKTINFSLQNEKIKGKNNLKTVYYFFPSQARGIVYLFHGANGSATYWVNNVESMALIKDLIAAKLAVIITEAEEVTLNKDINGDGSLRWNTSLLDSINNVDFANLKAITDTFYKRGVADRSMPRYTIGQSNGGSCSIAVGAYFKMKTSVAYCASGGAASGILSTTTTPLLFCLAAKDNNPVMGQTGNTNGLNNAQLLMRRGICSQSFVSIASPLYVSRFARSSVISDTLSHQIVNELKANNLLTAKNYFAGYSQTLWTAASNYPQNFPVISSLTNAQKNAIDEQLNCLVTDHQFYSDHNKATIRFLINQCN